MTNPHLFWKKSGAGIRLIVVNSLVFIAFKILSSILHLMKATETMADFQESLLLPAFIPGLLKQPWSLITHMFIHANFWHILFNMITLFFSYQLFAGYFNDKTFNRVYFLSGLSGALMFIFSVNIFPLFSDKIPYIFATGASAATIGVLMAICFYNPNGRVLLFGIWQIRLIILALVFVLLDLTQIGQGENEAGHLAHLGGALFGFIWASGMKKNRDITGFLSKISFFTNLKRFPGKKNRKPSRNQRPLTDEEWNQNRNLKQKRIDDILDKISRSGYDSLTKEEKKILFEISKEK